MANVFAAVFFVLISFINWIRQGKYLELFIGFWIVLVFADSAISYLNFATHVRPVLLLLLAFLIFSSKTEIKVHSFFIGFLPFILYSLLISSIYVPTLLISYQKVVSYFLLLLVVPSFVQFLRGKEESKFFQYLLYTGYAVLGVSILLMFAAPPVGATFGGRLNGLFRNPNGIGMFTALFGMLAIVLMNFRPAAFTKKDKWIGVGLIVVTLVLSGSRNSMVSLLLFLFIFQLSRVTNLLGIVVLVLLGITGGVILTSLQAVVADLGYAEFFRLDTLDMASGRIYAWQAAWLEIQRNFYWVGEGFAYSETTPWMEKYYGEIPDLIYHMGNIHSSYLTIWMNTGLVGVLLYFIPLLGYLIRAMFKTPFALPLLVGVGFMASFESFLMASLNPFTITFFMILTLLLQGKEFTPGQKEVPLPPQKAVA